jgi:TolB protein
MKLFSRVLMMALVLTAVPAMAQVSVRVSGAVKRYIAITGLAGDATVGSQLVDVLRNDMRLSGWMGLAQPSGAEFLSQGTVRVSGADVKVDFTVTQQATKKVVLSKTYSGSVQDLRRLAHTISDDIVQTITGQRGIALTKIAFVLKRGKNSELAVMDYDGHNVRQITNDRTISARPRWSPDGKRIVYTSYIHTYPDVVEANIYTHQRKALASFPGLNTGAEYSPDGQTIALTLSKDGNPELYTMNAGGGGFTRLTRTRRAESSPTWSPDGAQIAYVSDERGSPQIYVIGRNGGEPRQLTVSPSYNTEPSWSHPPAGADTKPMIAVTSRVGGKFAIGIYDPTTGEVKIVANDDADNQDPSWAPDGRHLVFSKMRNWRARLYLLDVLTGEQVELPAVEGGMSEPAWGP